MTTSGGEICSATPAQGAREDAVAAGGGDDGEPGGRIGGDQLAVQLDRAGQPDAAHLGDSLQLRERCEQVGEHGLELRRTFDEALPLDDVDVDEPCDTGSRVPGVRAAVEERRRRVAPEGLPHMVADDDGAQRHVAGADPLRAGHQVGREPVALAAEPASEAPEAGDHLVGDQQDAALAADRLHGRPVPVGWRDRAAGADHRLADERGSAVAELVERAGELFRIVVCDLDHVADERPEPVAHRGNPRQRRSVRVRAVVGELPRDDDRPLRLTRQLPVAADDLGGGVDRFAAAAPEEHRRVGHRRQRRDARSASSRAGPLAWSPKTWCEASKRSCAATASAISVRPCPTFANQSPAVASRYSVPSSSQTRQPSPRVSTSSCPSTLPIAANGCQRRVVVMCQG